MHLVLEIGECPNLEADIKVIDDSPFFVRPSPISESDKPFMDDQYLWKYKVKTALATPHLSC